MVFVKMRRYALRVTITDQSSLLFCSCGSELEVFKCLVKHKVLYDSIQNSL